MVTMTGSDDAPPNMQSQFDRFQTVLKKATEAIVKAETQQEADRLRNLREEVLTGFANQVSPDGAIALREEIRQFELMFIQYNLFDRFRNYQFECEKNLVQLDFHKIDELRKQLRGYDFRIKDEGAWANDLRSTSIEFNKLLNDAHFWNSIDNLTPTQQALRAAVTLTASVAGKVSRIFKK